VAIGSGTEVREVTYTDDTTPRYITHHTPSISIPTPRDHSSHQTVPQEKPIYHIQIAPTWKDIIKAHDESHAATKVYCNRSGIDGNIEAAVVLYNGARSPRVLCYHFGTKDKHAVYESEAVGLTGSATPVHGTGPRAPCRDLRSSQASIKSVDADHTNPVA
jgi:hypothetical protein